MIIRRVAALKTPAAFQTHLASLGITLPFDDTLLSGPEAPLAQACQIDDTDLGQLNLSNRFAVLPMEGWDGTTDGRPTDLVRRRWRNFGLSGAKLIWGGEAVAVRPDGRANPHQLMILPETVGDLANLRQELVDTHQSHYGQADELLIGLQLTHSGRFARPHDKKLEPAILYEHPILNKKFGLASDYPLMTDGDIEALIADFIKAAVLAQKAGFQFVDVKHCHGYLGHEFLSAIDRTGKYGGSFENRTRFLREVVAGIRTEAPGLGIGVRVSIFDLIPFKPGPDKTGVPEEAGNGYPYAFGSDTSGLKLDLTEPLAFLDQLEALNIKLVCLTAGSPYYNPHIQRPAIFPPSDGYQPPEDPLVGVARQINTAGELKRLRPNLTYVGTGYSYLQDWLPNVAQAVVRTGMADFVGLGRMILSYPELAADTLAGQPMQRKRICRTFSDCTTAPRNGMVSGCYPLDPFYKEREEFTTLAELKKNM